MAQAVAQAHLKGQVSFNFRFTPAVVRARQLMAAESGSRRRGGVVRSRIARPGSGALSPGRGQ
jgi:predicted dehydrogenase